MINEQLTPIETERALLGSLLINPEVIQQLAVSPDDFYLGRHKLIYSIMLRLHSAGVDIDPVVIQNELNNAGKLENIGGAAYLIQLLNETPSSLHAETYGLIIQDKARRRRLITIAEKLAKSAVNDNGSLDDSVSQLAVDLVRNSQSGAGAVPISDYLSKLYNQVVERYENPKDIFGIPTGFRKFDEITGGMQTGEMTVLSGEPGLGKSLLAMQMACGMAGNYPGAVYQMEMAGIAVVRRSASAVSGVATRKMRSGRLMDGDWNAINKAIEKLSTLPVYMSDASAWTTLAMKADLARLQDAYGIKWFVVDYMDLFADGHGKDNNERTAFISKQVHGMCKDLDLAGLVIQSMNKSGIGNAGMEKLSGSGKLMYDADQIIFMTQDEEADTVIRLTWDKMREGDSDRFMKLVRKPGYPVFGEYAHGL